jgi:hypothetical protein
MNLAWKICRKTKRNSMTQLAFEYDVVTRVMLSLCVWLMEYVPERSIGFIIDQPRVREVIAAWFGDRVVQTWFNEQIKPFLETEWFDDDSYSCRKGKGGLRAVLAAREKMEAISCGWTKDMILVKRDLRSFFMSIKTDLLENWMVDFIMQNFGLDEERRNRLMWLTRIIYRSLPQERMIMKSHGLAWLKLEPRKSMRGKIIGLPIGNVTSQTGANFVTTLYLRKLRELGYDFVHYTDDTLIFVTDYEQWKIDEKIIENYIMEELQLEWHRDKKYVQHISKGVEFLGIKLRYDRMLPSDRIAHNFKWKTMCAIEFVDKHRCNMQVVCERFQSEFNSYCGLLKWCNAGVLTGHVFEILMDTKLGKCFNLYDNKITIKKNKTKLAYFLSVNRRRKRKLSLTKNYTDYEN